MNRKSLVLVAAALLVWALVALRFTRLTRDPLPVQMDERAQPPSSPVRAVRPAFVVPADPAYGDPFEAGRVGVARAQDAGVGENTEVAYDFSQGADYGAPEPLPLSVKGVVGTSALLVLPDGQTLLVRVGDYVRLSGYPEMYVQQVFHTGVTLSTDGRTTNIFVQQ